MTIHVVVTQEHIEQGTVQNRYHCPLALAIKEATGTKCGVGTKLVYTESHSCLWSLPESAQRFVRRYDEGYPLEAFEFDLTEPQGEKDE